MTNNPCKVKALQNFGIKIVARIPLVIHHNPFNISYLHTKATKLGHFLPHLSINDNE